MSQYERDTRTAYRSPARAAQYQAYHTRDWSWGRLSTIMERRCLERLLRPLMRTGDRVLDVPCGTGILASLLNHRGIQVVAADIAAEMMALARDAYAADTCRGYLQCDITSMPLATRSVDSVMTIGFMHRVPAAVRRAALAELFRICRRYAVISISLDTPAQRFKHRVLHLIRRQHVPAPRPATAAEIEADITAAGFRLAARAAILPFFSAESLYVIVKPEPHA
jgi:ubiquinone/menaquinone biosynthesis C-methylase UbiE